MSAYRSIVGLLICLIALSGCQTRDYGNHKVPPSVTRPAAQIARPSPDAGVMAGGWCIPRSQWAVEKVRIDRATPMGVKPYRITVHHSDEIKMDDGTRETGNAVTLLRFIETSHVKGIGKNEPFACIGYHFIIANDGRVYEGRPLQFQGAHATGDNNIGNIGICLLGDFDKHQVPAAQKQRLVEVLDRLCRTYGIRASRSTVLCHKDFKPTACPGKHLEPIVRGYESGSVR